MSFSNDSSMTVSENDVTTPDSSFAEKARKHGWDMKLEYVPFEVLEDYDSFAEFQNCRKHSSNVDLGDLEESIERSGLFTPLVVWKHPFKNGPTTRPWSDEPVSHQYTLIAGYRRYSAISNIKARNESRFETIPCLVFEGTLREAVNINFIENIQRVNLTPIEVCDQLVFMRKTFKLKQKELAELVGKSEAWVSKAIRFVEKAHPDLLAIARGEITKTGERVDEADFDELDGGAMPETLDMSFSAAMTLSELPVEEQVASVDKYISTYQEKGKKKASSELLKETKKDKKEKKEKKNKSRSFDDIMTQFNSYRDVLKEQEDDPEIDAYMNGLLTALYWAANGDVPDTGDFWQEVHDFDGKLKNLLEDMEISFKNG
jgi:ParB/RepB/Spo0J family partition protein